MRCVGVFALFDAGLEKYRCPCATQTAGGHVRGYSGIFILDRSVVSGQILIALAVTRKTKKRSSKSDYYWRNDGNFRTGKSAVFVDGRPSRVFEKSENLSEPIFGIPQIKKYNTYT